MSRSLPTSRAPREAEDRPVAGGDVAWIHRNDDLPSVELAPGQREGGGMPAVAPGAVSSEDGSMGGDGCVRQVCAARSLLALLGGLER